MALDPALIEKYRRVKALAERGEGGERDNALARKARFEAEHPGIAAAAAAAEAREAVEAATRHAPPPPGRPPGAPFTRPPAGPPPRPPPWSAGFHGPQPEPRTPPRGPKPPRPAPQPDAGPTAGSRIRDFFSSEFVKRAASVAGDVLGDLGAGMTLGELANTADVDVAENTRTLKITLRVPIESVREARRLTGNTSGLAQLLAARLRDELVEALAEIDHDAD